MERHCRLSLLRMSVSMMQKSSAFRMERKSCAGESFFCIRLKIRIFPGAMRLDSLRKPRNVFSVSPSTI